MANDFNALIATWLSRKLLPNFDNNPVMMSCVNTDYQGEFTQNGGDTALVQRFDDVTVYDYYGTTNENSQTPTQTPFVIDQAKYFNIKISDINQGQSIVNIIKNYAKRGDIAMQLAIDTFLLSQVAYAHTDNTFASQQVTKNNIVSIIKDIVIALMDQNTLDSKMMYNGKSPFVVLNPTLFDLLLEAPQLTQATVRDGNFIRTGKDGNELKIYGANIKVTTNFTDDGGTYNVLGGTTEGISYARQLKVLEQIRDNNGFYDKLRCLLVFGAKVLNTQAIVKAPLTL